MDVTPARWGRGVPGPDWSVRSFWTFAFWRQFEANVNGTLELQSGSCLIKFSATVDAVEKVIGVYTHSENVASMLERNDSVFNTKNSIQFRC